MSTLINSAVIAHDCPDCLSETRIMHLGDNVHVIQVLHDDTCPTLARMESNQ